MIRPWLTIVGIGEDGVDGLSAAARRAIAGAALVAGGRRHLAHAASLITGEAVAWPSPIEAGMQQLLTARPRPVTVLASGDPHWFGIGAMLARHVDTEEMFCIPQASAFSLACARLGWALQDCETISFCGRPLGLIARVLQPGACVLALSADERTPQQVAAILVANGFGASRLHLLEALGGAQERRRCATAETFGFQDVNSLNMLAIEMVAGPSARVIPLVAGLPEQRFGHDGQITKPEIRAVTLAALAPRRGELLWDIGAGAGSVAIEWMLRHPSCRAIGIERDAARAARIARNADSFGVPGLQVVRGDAPAVLNGLPRPDAVFVGGGAHLPGMLDTAWEALPAEGRLVVNAVTIESEGALLEARQRFGGTLTRIAIERLAVLGDYHGYRPAMTVTQFVALKP
jgi:precorrin-6Y C5,15-methyltransferase (decarboxylating)